MKIAIYGDSFASPQYDPQNLGWPILLKNNLIVHNYAMSGVSEYKILQTLKKSDLSQFDKILIVHTSPNRIYVPHNPLHQNTKYHKQCDIIFSDIEHKRDEFSVACQQYFKYIFDIEYASDLHNLICKNIDEITNQFDTSHITFFDYTGLYQFNNKLRSFYETWLINKGSINHLSSHGNSLIYLAVLEILGIA